MPGGRTLVYKYVVNRTDMLTALYVREAERLHVRLSHEVLAAETVEKMLLGLLRGSARCRRTGATLRCCAAGGYEAALRQVQRGPDRRTSSFFTNHLVEAHGPP